MNYQVLYFCCSLFLDCMFCMNCNKKLYKKIDFRESVWKELKSAGFFLKWKTIRVKKFNKKIKYYSRKHFTYPFWTKSTFFSGNMLRIWLSTWSALVWLVRVTLYWAWKTIQVHIVKYYSSTPKMKMLYHQSFQWIFQTFFLTLITKFKGAINNLIFVLLFCNVLWGPLV